MPNCLILANMSSSRRYDIAHVDENATPKVLDENTDLLVGSLKDISISWKKGTVIKVRDVVVFGCLRLVADDNPGEENDQAILKARDIIVIGNLKTSGINVNCRNFLLSPGKEFFKDIDDLFLEWRGFQREAARASGLRPIFFDYQRLV